RPHLARVEESFMLRLLAGLLVVVVLFGCGSSGMPEVKSYPVKATAPLDEAKALLQNYANGQPMASEAASFPDLVERVRQTDPQKADILAKGLADMEKSKTNIAGKAKALLQKL